MAGNPGRRLLDVLQRELLGGLRDTVAKIADDLTGLEVDPTYEGTAFAGRVLALVRSDHPVITALRALESSGPGAGLHGWRDERAEGAPPGMAYVVRGPGQAVVALSVGPGNGPELVLRAAGFSAGQAVQLPLAGGFALRVDGRFTGEEFVVRFFPDRPPVSAALSVGDRIEFSLTRTAPGRLVGVEGGPSVSFGAVSAGGWVAATATDSFDLGGHLGFDGGEVALAPGFVGSLVPVDLTFPLDVDLRTAPGAGVALAGSPSLRTRLAGSDRGRWLDVAIDVDDTEGAPALLVSFLASVDASLPGAPVGVKADGLGLRLPLSLRLGTPLLPDAGALQALEPDGAGVSLDLPVVSGSGMLARVGDDLAGALAVSIPPMSASAFGVLSPARAGQPLSFLVVMGASFPPPGVQIGFGFAVSGVGGVVGVNRRIDRDALLRAVADGSAAQLLFPSDPVRAGAAAVRALPGMFPAARGSMVAGPMFQLSWGARIVTMSVAVLVESSSQDRMTIVGKLVIALPDLEAPLVFLQATFAGLIDASEPSAMFVASLTGSHIVGAPVSGDLLFLTRGGSDPAFVVSAGGFHPAYPLPRGLPPMRRLSMDLCPAPWIDLRCENYFALTSNTLQFGARLELVAEVAGCGLRGWLAFDAILQYSPFRFVADVSAGIALRAFGETLMGVALALHLEGPAPYLARGRGSIDLWLFEVSFDFEVGWGLAAAELGGRVDVGDELRRALRDPAAWRLHAAAPPGLVLGEAARKSLSNAAIIDPYGTISVRQERVPLGVEIQRFGGVPVPPQRWDVTAGRFGAGEPARVRELRAQFAPGQFIAAGSDDQALTVPAFLPLKAGVAMRPEPASGADARPVPLVWEERVIARDVAVPVPAATGSPADVGDLEIVLTAMSSADPGWWVVPDAVPTVEPVPPVTAVFSWSMAPVDGLAAPTPLDVPQAVTDSRELTTVESWEVSG